MIRLDGVSRSWPEFAIRHVSLEVKQGQYLVILGPTGSGKTLLLELLLGIHHPDAGRIFIHGRDVTGDPVERRGIGMVYQDYVLFPHLTVEQNLGFGLRYRKLSDTERRRRIAAAARLLSVDHLLQRYENTLSGGEKQRVALGRALVTEPAILLLDEPLSALDRGIARRLRGELKALHQAKGLTTIHVTHDLSEARQLGDAVALLREGSLHAIGTPEDLLCRPPSLFAANFVGAVNLYSAAAARPIMSDPAITNGCAGWVMVRPQDVVLRTAPVSAMPNVLAGEIIAMQEEGSIVEVRIRVVGLEAPLTVHSSRQTLGEQRLTLGSAVHADLRGAIHILQN
jgi:ABC-type Fe3+/spermidine/putrescine transport system ATPase subunit